MSAKDSTLALIHELQAAEMLKILKKYKESGEDMSPQHMAQISKFLKDNDITSDMDKNPKMKEISEEVQEANKVPFDVLGSNHPLELLN